MRSNMEEYIVLDKFVGLVLPRFTMGVYFIDEIGLHQVDILQSLVGPANV